MLLAAFEAAACRARVMPAGSQASSDNGMVICNLPPLKISVRLVIVSGGVILALVAAP
jgi:hypothetical protein